MNFMIRQQQILELVKQRGYISIEEIAQIFSVTPQTVRRDINQMADAGLLRRYHGGAAIDSSVNNTEYSTRMSHNAEAKQRIAVAVAKAVPDHASLFINIGTTTEAIAVSLLQHCGLKVITNNLNVAKILSVKEDFEVLIASGKVRSDGGVIGQATSEFFKQFKVDYAVIGISGIDAEGTLLDFDFQEVSVSQEIIAGARQIFLAADDSKFGRHAMMRMGHLREIDRLFTNLQPDEPYLQQIHAAEVNLIVA
ncbi:MULTISPECIES: DeoR family transcriptional regulator [unclassified Acinetobacter]|uniref:DeoR/GlpR family DNA-binding transcription regulator n=1 Tax=unclassified Acinetobacter TaxID=196816 RepID=UPI0018AB0010|nr:MULTISPECIES: DeoR family transcriptional regulator [unclassified Acinetobacter]MBJ9952766.1 DeoR family transcriptional regulator [Acinetobacter baumannii]